jgi:hypothetical protein
MMSPREFCLAGISGDGRPQLPAGTRGRPVSGRVQRDSQRSAPRWATKQPLCRRFSTGATGLEPATSGVTGRRRARSTTFDRPPARAGNHPGLSDPSSALPPATGYKTGTSARARAGTRGPRRSRETARSPGETCPGVPARARASLTCLSLVMKGSPVRVRASASKSPAKALLVLTGQNTSEVLQTGLIVRFGAFRVFPPVARWLELGFLPGDTGAAPGSPGSIRAFSGSRRPAAGDPSAAVKKSRAWHRAGRHHAGVAQSRRPEQ